MVTHSKVNLPNQTLTFHEYSDLCGIPILAGDSDHNVGDYSDDNLTLPWVLLNEVSAFSSASCQL
jgi:hypothetical protein